MKDAKHHLKHLQKKVIQSVKKEENNESLNNKENLSLGMMPLGPEFGRLSKKVKPVLNEKRNSADRSSKLAARI